MTQTLPSVSVVIPARDADPTILDAVDSIDMQTYPNVCEVIVATPGDLPRGLEERVKRVDNPSGTTPDALNIAIKASKGEVIVRCDSHAILPPEYVERAVSTLDETGAGNVGGMQIPVGHSFWSKSIAAAMSSPLGAGDARYRLGGPAGPVETVYLGTFRKSTLDQVGGFNPAFIRNQDFELNYRLREQGQVVWFDPRLRVAYRPRASIGRLARQYFDFGRGKRRFAQTHPGKLLPRQMAPTALVVALAGALALGFWWSPAWWLPFGYAVGLIAAGLATVPNIGFSALGVPFALATMHISWGLGFLRG